MLARHQHPGDDGKNAHIPTYTGIEQVNGLSTFFSFITVVVMYWEARMRTKAYISRTLFVSCVIP